METVSRAQTLPRRRELCVGGSAAPRQAAERVAQVVGTADDADLEGQYAALVVLMFTKKTPAGPTRP